MKRQYLFHKKEIDYAVQEVIDGAHFISGPQVGQLEKELSDYVGVGHCVACANGTDALQLALMAWGIGAGDAVFVPDFTFFSSGEVVPLVGAVPVFVDIDRDTFNISADSLCDAVEYVLHHTELTPRAVVAVDLFGQPADFEAVRRVADAYSLLVLEDAAQGFGGMTGERRACSFGDISITSFFPAKPLGCYGDGGAVFTDNREWAERLKSLHVHGKGNDKYDNVRIGLNSRLDTMQAAVLIEKLKFFEEELTVCSRVAEAYDERLRDVVKTPVILAGNRSCWAQYTICLRDAAQREEVMAQMKADGIPSAVYYRKPMHRQEAFRGMLCGAERCGNTEYICDRCLSLPMHPYLEDKEIDAVCESVKKAVG